MIGVPCDATDEEKDQKMRDVSPCSRHVILEPEIDDCPELVIEAL